ncbi:hypothetical protein Ari01nite_70500 [Paractinoplanes rishiriensis]|uniref:Uncharacterized protein n=1 Tax=Paractinoplanes rishiriensis TaxID=1050105 RepID=A0A919K2N9_9ACTN|nr:hypothetical protein Ari01nite_70500 [Actinoplanes rishiriensis]
MVWADFSDTDVDAADSSLVAVGAAAGDSGFGLAAPDVERAEREAEAAAGARLRAARPASEAAPGGAGSREGLPALGAAPGGAGSRKGSLASEAAPGGAGSRKGAPALGAGCAGWLGELTIRL